MEAVSIVIGRIIGSGIFRTPGPIMALTVSTGLFGAVWAVGGIVTIFGAVCYAELVAMMPKSGGPYVYLKEAYGEMWAFLRGWAMFFVSETGAIAAVALVFAEYFSSFLSATAGYTLMKPATLALALAAVWMLTAVNLFGVFFSGMIQNIFSSIKIAAVLAIIAVCFSGDGRWANFTDPVWPEEFTWGTLLAAGAALRYSFFAFSGWEGATYVAEEVKDPGRNLPLSLFLGITGVMFLYAGANAAYLYQLPAAEMAASKWVAADAMRGAAGGLGAALISAAVMINTFGNVSTQILCKARTWQAMARDNLFFKVMGDLHPLHRTPNKALIIQGVWASVLLLFAGLAKNSYETIIDFFSANGTIFNIMTFAAVFILRKKYPDLPRPYRAWFYPWSVIIIIILYSAFLVITLITAPIQSLCGLLLTSTGLIYYYYKVKKRT
jgi:amino acid transporter